MRVFEGMEITSEFVDDLVDEWHENDMPTSLAMFIVSNTGWTVGEYSAWLQTGAVPE